jgi:hypothetical protein
LLTKGIYIVIPNFEATCLLLCPCCCKKKIAKAAQ